MGGRSLLSYSSWLFGEHRGSDVFDKRMIPFNLERFLDKANLCEGHTWSDVGAEPYSVTQRTLVIKGDVSVL